ncbi:hypothetical protein ALC56_10282 [Trachymyrmex septentrionalis]|uniref:Uncharacterized protein n=1 Tax=Trachymyrmex septentrionalis TaxID=34720 RepID=A0A195F5I9_9HYME|nr:hypothetical protein ALC56_10282 [Trachymyrmex septentrionalis]
MVVSPLGKDWPPSEEYPCLQKHLSKNSPFGTGIKTISPICLWQLNNQCAHHKHIREVNTLEA